jgi:predicted nucleic acid-binding protein
MKTSTHQFIDANLIMYAIGAPHPLREPCRATLTKIKSGSLQVVTNTEVLQEILYRHFSLNRSERAEVAYDATVGICSEGLPVTHHDMDLALDLLKRYPGISSRDAVHAATMIHNDISEILSTNSHFDAVSEIQRIPPS